MARRALALAMLLLLTACTAEPATEATDEPFEFESVVDLYQTPENLDQIIYRVEQATFLIECPEGVGSGWGYTHRTMDGDTDFIVTNHHVIESCLKEGELPEVSDGDWNTFSAEVVAWQINESDPDELIDAQDIAILLPIDHDIETLREYSTDHPKGAWVMTSSYPGLDDDFFTHAITIGNIVAKTVTDGVIITAAINPGSSGGVVIDSHGRVLGTIYAGFDQSDMNDTGFYLPMRGVWEVIREFELNSENRGQH